MQMLDPSIAAARMYSNSSRFIEAYHAVLQPLCREAELPALALDILLFIANNPDKSTARDVCQFRGMKPGIVSFHVDRLAAAGLLERRPVPGDRRKTQLVCTEAAADIIRRGRELQGRFAEALLTRLDRESLETFHRCLAAIDGNIDNIRRNGV